MLTSAFSYSSKCRKQYSKPETAILRKACLSVWPLAVVWKLGWETVSHSGIKFCLMIRVMINLIIQVRHDEDLFNEVYAEHLLSFESVEFQCL